jgi:hypothetical protein
LFPEEARVWQVPVHSGGKKVVLTDAHEVEEIGAEPLRRRCRRSGRIGEKVSGTSRDERRCPAEQLDG